MREKARRERLKAYWSESDKMVSYVLDLQSAVGLLSQTQTTGMTKTSHSFQFTDSAVVAGLKGRFTPKSNNLYPLPPVPFSNQIKIISRLVVSSFKHQKPSAI